MSFSKLDQDMIVRESLALLAEGGLAQVSLRKIATRLNVGVSSLYWHVKDRDALFRLMSQTIYRRCLEAVPQSRTWQQWLQGFGNALWDAQWNVRDARQLIVLSTVDEKAARQGLERLVATLAALGLREELGAIAVQAVQALVTGWTTLEARRSVPVDHAAFARALQILIAGFVAETRTRTRPTLSTP